MRPTASLAQRSSSFTVSTMSSLVVAGFKAVSYTHLDVYKRQSLDHPRPALRPGETPSEAELDQARERWDGARKKAEEASREAGNRMGAAAVSYTHLFYWK